MKFWFDGDDAQRWGLPAAAILAHIRYWVERNSNAGQTPCMTQSIADMVKYLPFLTKSQIQRNLAKLEKANAIYRKGNGFDRRHTYCLNPEMDNGGFRTESTKTQKRTIEDLDVNLVHIESNTSNEIKKQRNQDLEYQRPTEAEVIAYMVDRGAIDMANDLGTEFWNYYEANGWMVNGTPIAKWKPKANQWINRERNKQSNDRRKGFDAKNFTPDGLRDFIDNG